MAKIESSTERDRIESVALVALLAFTVVAVAGYGMYGLHPERLPQSEFARNLFRSSFQLFARVHILLSAAVLGVVLVRRLGVRWILPFLAVCGLSFTAEHVGTGYGVPFGGYGYTGLLGLKIGGRVPALIPVSWFLMALPAWILAARAFEGPGGRGGRIALGALWLVAWDLALDPAMSFLTPYWQWAETGPYYGMPWLNLVGWYTTGLILLTVLELTSERAGWRRLDTGWVAGYYATIVLMPLGMLAAAGAWLAVGVTALGMAACEGLTRTAAQFGVVAARRPAIGTEVRA